MNGLSHQYIVRHKNRLFLCSRDMHHTINVFLMGCSTGCKTFKVASFKHLSQLLPWYSILLYHHSNDPDPHQISVAHLPAPTIAHFRECSQGGQGVAAV